MFVVFLFTSLLLAALLAYAAVRKLSHRPDVVASYARVGVPESRLDLLAGVLFAGVTGVMGGIFIKPLGIVATAGLMIYFLAALTAHLAHRDRGNAVTPLVILALAVSTFVLRILVG